MAILLFLLAIAGGVLVGALTLENTAAGSVTLLDRWFTGFSQGQLLAVMAALGFVVGVLAVGSLSLRRARRVRRRELRRVERDLTADVAELERENRSMREELARRASSSRRPGMGPIPPDRAADATMSGAEQLARPRPVPTDRHPEPVYEQARQATRLRSTELDR